MSSFTYVQYGFATVKCKGYYDPCSITCGTPKNGNVITGGLSSRTEGWAGVGSRLVIWSDGVSLRTTTRQHQPVGHPSSGPIPFNSISVTDFSSTVPSTAGNYTYTTATYTTLPGTYKGQESRYETPNGGHVYVPIYKLQSDALSFVHWTQRTLTNGKKSSGYYQQRLGGPERRIPGAWLPGGDSKVPLFSKTTSDLSAWINSANT
jgi:hypothetical protein